MPLSGRCDKPGDLDHRLIPLFAEVQLRCPLGICVERERTRSTGLAPPGVYAQAGQPGSAVPGVDLPYAESLSPEVRLDTNAVDLWTQGQEVLCLARRLSRRSARSERRWVSPGEERSA